MLYKVWSIRPKWLSLDVKTFKNWDEILLTISQSRPVWTLGFTLGLSKSNRWVKLADHLPWDRIEKEYNKRLRNSHNSAGNKPARMVVGGLIVKHVEKLSDEKTIQAILENPYMQYLLGLEKFCMLSNKSAQLQL